MSNQDKQNKPKDKLIEVGFSFRGMLYVFSADPPDTIGVITDPSKAFEKVQPIEPVAIPCTIKPSGELTGCIEAHWHRIDKRLLDAAPNKDFIYQPDQGAEQEELFSALLKVAEEMICDAMYFEKKAAEDRKEIAASRKNFS